MHARIIARGRDKQMENSLCESGRRNVAQDLPASQQFSRYWENEFLYMNFL